MIVVFTCNAAYTYMHTHIHTRERMHAPNTKGDLTNEHTDDNDVLDLFTGVKWKYVKAL